VVKQCAAPPPATCDGGCGGRAAAGCFCDDFCVRAGDCCSDYTRECIGVTQLALGLRQTCALLSTGAVRCWGYGEFGVLGYGNTDNVGDDETPADVGDVPLGGRALQIAAGGYHTCALLTNGRIKCWGRNDHGQLGYGHTNDIGDDETPAAAGYVQAGGRAVEIAAGHYHTCARLENGKLTCWGWGAFGALGYGSTDDIGDDEHPVDAGVVGLGGMAEEVVAGEFRSCARYQRGRWWCWGGNAYGELGIGRTDGTYFAIGDDETPSLFGFLPAGAPVDEISIGDVATCARLGTDAKCWGAQSAHLGYGDVENLGDDETPDAIPPLNVGGPVAQVARGGEHTCVLLQTGRVKCWGAVVLGGLGYPGTAFAPIPDGLGAIDLGGHAVQLESGYGHICVIMDGGGVRCWGNGAGGKLGHGSTEAIGDDETPASWGDVPVL